MTGQESHMHQKAQELLSEIHKLPEEDQWNLLAKLMDDLQGEEKDGSEDDWVAVIDRRVAKAMAGDPGIPSHQVHANILNKLRGQ
jgi:hypothetical protein